MKTLALLLLARFKRFYDGEDIEYPRKEHIKGAKNIPYNEMAEESNAVKSKEALAGYFNPISANQEKKIVMYFLSAKRPVSSIWRAASRVIS